MPMSAPPRVKNIEEYWTEPPAEQSARCTWWVERIRAGWKRNKRIHALGYYERAAFFGVYIWEQLHVVDAALKENRA